MNQKLDLDFVERQTFSFGQFNLLTLLICLIGCMLMAYVIKEYQSLNSEYEQIALQLQHKMHQETKKEIVKKVNVEEVPEAELKKIHETVADLSTPWDALLSALEAIQNSDIALLVLEPNKKKQHVTLTGQAKNIQTMLSYVEAVSSLKMLSNVYLQNHMIDVSDPNKPVSFTIVANWK